MESPEGWFSILACVIFQKLCSFPDQPQVVYNHQVFPSSEAFLEAFNNGTLIRIPKGSEINDLSWTTRKRVGPKRDLDHLPGPRSVSFAGLRYRVDRAQQYVSWMGWSMYIGFDRDMGLSLWDINLKGERIIYQVICFAIFQSLRTHFWAFFL